MRRLARWAGGLALGAARSPGPRVGLPPDPAWSKPPAVLRAGLPPARGARGPPRGHRSAAAAPPQHLRDPHRGSRAGPARPSAVPVAGAGARPGLAGDRPRPAGPEAPRGDGTCSSPFVRDATGEWNLPPGEPGGTAPPPDLRPWLDASYSLDRTRVEARDAAGDFEVTAPEIRLAWAGSAARGTIEAAPGVDWRSGERRGHVAVSDMSLESDGRALRASGLSLTAPEGRLELTAALVPLQAPGLKLDATGHAEVAALLGPAGRADVWTFTSARRGPWTSRRSASTRPGISVAYGDLAVGAEARGRVEAAQVTLETRLDTAGGWLKAAARIPRGAPPTRSGVTASWEGFDLARLARTFAPPKTPLALDGRLAGTLEAQVGRLRTGAKPPSTPRRGSTRPRPGPPSPCRGRGYRPSKCAGAPTCWTSNTTSGEPPRWRVGFGARSTRIGSPPLRFADRCGSRSRSPVRCSRPSPDQESSRRSTVASRPRSPWTEPSPLPAPSVRCASSA